ncbi:MAG: ABC transporter ATP-binding protein [Chloroflexota bacterium]|nr:ABC transporter ATP-binding protein [Chloroflexota bacterium]
MTSALSLDQVSLSLGAFALRDISFTLAPGEIFVVLGPSGAGKSVLLETIAGFYRPDAGTIKIGERDLTAAPPEARRIGFMFQDYALFPHLTVAQNIQFARRDDPPRARELLARLNLTPLADRKPANLSGGEKQRVALARALAMDPALFLFDEPLSALDARARDALRDELGTLLRQLGLPAIYVTHDQTEALVLADKIAVLRDGALLQIGAPSEIFNTPADEFVANFVGVETVLEGQVLSASDGDVRIALGDREIHAVGEHAARHVLVCIRPEDVALARGVRGDSSVRNQFDARVVAVAALGPLFKITLDCGFPLVAYVTKQSYLELQLAPGARVVASVKATAIHLIPR